ncbi:MAG: hypothetical protein CME61_01930 [Halobacteriovoraceae bacterium]|nr:hypothetical protein [Halobacteriovoraceae bacterium]
MKSSLTALLVFLFLISVSYTQDELWLITSDKNKRLNEKVGLKESTKRLGDLYKIDLNHDSFKDGLLFKANDFEQQVVIFDSKGQKVATFSMPYVGFGSGALKYSLNYIGHGVSILVIYFSEGRIKYLQRESKVRTYLLTINKKLEKKNIYFQKGPVLLGEYFSDKHKHLFERVLEIKDLNNDNLKEIILSSRHGNKNVLKLNDKLFWEIF